MSLNAKLIDSKGFYRYMEVPDRRPVILYAIMPKLLGKVMTTSDLIDEVKVRHIEFILDETHSDGLLIYREK